MCAHSTPFDCDHCKAMNRKSVACSLGHHSFNRVSLGAKQCSRCGEIQPNYPRGGLDRLVQDSPMTLGMPNTMRDAYPQEDAARISDLLGSLERDLSEANADRHRLAARVARLESFIGPAGLKRLEKLPR